MPDEIYFLCLLHNVGATSSEKSLTIDEISRWTMTDPERVRENLDKLVHTEYIKTVLKEGNERYHLTVNGIRKVLSMYS